MNNVQTVTLLRFQNLDSGSEGALFFPGGTLLTLELPWRQNEPGRSCIPEGSYPARWWKSPSKGWCYRIYDVPGRNYILIHAANWAGDVEKGMRTDLLGCIALGSKRGTYKGQRGLFLSRPAMTRFNTIMQQQNFILEVKNADSYIPV